MLKIILQLLLIILIFSCQKQQVPSVVTIKVPEIANDVWMTMSEIVDTAIYIPLETTDECLIDASMFRRMEYYKGKFYCFVFTGGLYIFDRNGRFQKLIPIGRAPGELNVCNSHKAFLIDKKNDRLVFPGWYKFYASIYFNVPNRIASFISLYRLNYLPKNQPIGKLPIISNSCIINLHSFINKLITRAILKIITSTSCNARLNCLNLCIISIKNL